MLAVGFASCKKEGCTDPLATNFDSDAKDNDGSCVYAPIADTDGPEIEIKSPSGTLEIERTISLEVDFLDLNELNTGTRREGVFGAIYWWMVKVGFAIAGAFSGLIIWIVGFNSELPTTEQVGAVEGLHMLKLAQPAVDAALEHGAALAVCRTLPLAVDDKQAAQAQAVGFFYKLENLAPRTLDRHAVGAIPAFADCRHHLGTRGVLGVRCYRILEVDNRTAAAARIRDLSG